MCCVEQMHVDILSDLLSGSETYWNFFTKTKMTTLAVRATAVKNNTDTEKISDIRFMLLKLPKTNVFTADDSGLSDSGVWIFFWSWFIFSLNEIQIHVEISWFNSIFFPSNVIDVKKLLDSFKIEYSTAQSVDQQLTAVNKVNYFFFQQNIIKL